MRLFLVGILDLGHHNIMFIGKSKQVEVEMAVALMEVTLAVLEVENFSLLVLMEVLIMEIA